MSLTDNDRVLVLGASGWFGRTFLDLVGNSLPMLAVASTTRASYRAWDFQTVRDFNPTLVVNFAFVLRDFLPSVGHEAFVATNEELTARFLQAAQLPSVRSVVTASSGAAVSLPLNLEANPYGVLKQREELAALSLASASRHVVVARAWSVSGAHVRRPRDYAFSDFIVQARSGRIEVKSTRPTFRRYVAAADFLAVCTERAVTQWSGTIDSGGELIELGELARLVAEQLNPGAVVERAPLASTVPSTYASDNDSWTRACSELEFRPANLIEQIKETAAALC